MILLAGIPSESPAALAVEAAEREGVPYLMFNQREAALADLAITHRDEGMRGVLRYREEDWALEGFAGVYVRLMDHKDLPENRTEGLLRTEPDCIRKSSILHELMLEWLEVAACRVLNRGSDMASNVSKPYQAQLIAKSGLLTPPTLVTNDVETVREFQRRHGRVVFKSISSVRSIVRELRDVKVADLEAVRNVPTQFQSYIPGTNVRVHIVGDALFATEVRSEAVDYRYAGRDGLDVEMDPTELPAAVEVCCFDLAWKLRLPLCGIDLKRTPDGDFYCFEVNPCPGYSYYQESTGQDIAGAIVRYLERGTARLQ